MPFYQWTQSMSVGVALLDSDHQALIELINRLHEHLEAEEADKDAAALDEIFDRLVAYIDYHFAREEKVMEACEYPLLDSHRDEHLDFTQQIRYVRDRYVKSGDAEIGQELLDFLKNWLTHHILIQDMEYRTYVEVDPRASDAAQSFGPGLSDPHWTRATRLPTR